MNDFFQRYVLYNLPLKLISLALAVGVWLAVTREPIAEIAVDAPIEFHNIPANLEISSQNVPKAQIRLRGPERIIRQLQPHDVYAAVDLGDAKPSERTFDLTARQVRAPSGLEVVQVVPSDFHIALDTRLTRQVPVHPRVVGTFADGYAIDHIDVNPSVITISGPASRVQGVEAAITDPVDVSGVVDRASFVRPTYVSDPLVQMLNAHPVQITIIMGKTQSTTRH